MEGVKLGVFAAQGYQVVVLTKLNNTSVGDNRYAIRVFYSRETVSNNDGGSSLAKLVQRLLNQNFGGVVKSTCRLVKNKYGRVLKEYASNRKP